MTLGRNENGEIEKSLTKKKIYNRKIIDTKKFTSNS